MRVHLHRAVADNGGRFVDAGVDIDVGGEPDQLDETRATELLDTGGAIDPEATTETVEQDAERHDHQTAVEA